LFGRGRKFVKIILVEPTAKEVKLIIKYNGGDW